MLKTVPGAEEEEEEDEDESEEGDESEAETNSEGPQEVGGTDEEDDESDVLGQEEGSFIFFRFISDV